MNNTHGNGNTNTPGGAAAQEHTRLLAESLASFEANLSRASAHGAGADVLRGAQSVVGAASRLNEMLRFGAARALEEQVRAEVDGVEAGVGDVWGRVGAEYREGLRASDELVRGLTGLFLGVGKAVRELVGEGGGVGGALGGAGGVHVRSVSLDEEGLRKRGSMSPDVGGVVPRTASGPGSSGGGSAGASASGASGSGRRSVESRRSWEPSGGMLRDDVSRRLAARTESALGGARPASAFSTLRERERERTITLDTSPQGQQGSANRALAGTPSGMTRRLFTPREQRELQMTTAASGGVMPTITSQETFYGEYDSPTPASRTSTTTLDRSRTLPPKPLPSLPSESIRRNQTITEKTGTPSNTIRDRDHDRRKPSAASISTVRANTTSTSSSFPVPASLTSPANATTALTPHTVSTQTPDRTAFPSLPRTDSDRSVRSSVTFSRSSAVSSVTALTGVRQQDTQRQRQRTISNSGSGSGSAEPSMNVPVPIPAPVPAPAPAPPMMSRDAQSGSETERPPRRQMQTLGGRAGRMSLDGMQAETAGRKSAGTVTAATARVIGNGNGHAADRSAAAGLGVGGGGMLPPMNTAARRERRRTVTDIWPQE
ncbi:hypothetical protein C0991_004329 [Blastosporella zonata]|nr:hypothetical protein C0991_004329 [Blastosporella zonata]